MIVEFVAQLLKQAVDREADFFSVYRAGFNLIDIEQGVEHACHRAQGFIKAANQHLASLGLNMLSQQALQQDKRLQRLGTLAAGVGGARMIPAAIPVNWDRFRSSEIRYGPA